jgi:hypothetical protein
MYSVPLYFTAVRQMTPSQAGRHLIPNAIIGTVSCPSDPDGSETEKTNAMNRLGHWGVGSWLDIRGNIIGLPYFVDWWDYSDVDWWLVGELRHPSEFIIPVWFCFDHVVW